MEEKMWIIYVITPCIVKNTWRWVVSGASIGVTIRNALTSQTSIFPRIFPKPHKRSSADGHKNQSRTIRRQKVIDRIIERNIEKDIISKTIVKGRISWSCAEVEFRIPLQVIERGLGRHESVNRAKLGTLRIPFHLIYWPFLRWKIKKTRDWRNNAILFTHLQKRETYPTEPLKSCL